MKTKKIKIPDFSKTIGLARNIRGFYEPSNQRQTSKIVRVLIERGFDLPKTFEFDEDDLSILRDQARRVGYKIITTAGRIVRP